MGRDVLSRLLYGGRVSLFVGIISTAVSVVIGIPLGMIAAFYRGVFEIIVMRLSDIFMSFPATILILFLVSMFGPSIITVTVVIGVLGWPKFARQIYGSVLSVREKDYIEGGIAIGARDSKIITRYILPDGNRADIHFHHIQNCICDYIGILTELSWNGSSATCGFLGKYAV